MRTLGIETSTHISSVALFAGGKLVAEDIFSSRLVLCDQLMRRIVRIVGDEMALDRIAVSCGPGSFTGLRIGLATAKALGHALEIPVACVPTQHVLAAGCGPEHSSVGVVQRARIGHVYAGLYRIHEGAVECLSDVELMETAGLYDKLGEAELVVGDGWGEAVAGDERLAELRQAGPPYDIPRASITVMLGEWPEGFSIEQLAALKPEYLLASQAERIHGIEIQ
jgi:tRNA threonylcarbamoyladenosine biosynthesis protein TsaB